MSNLSQLAGSAAPLSLKRTNPTTGEVTEVLYHFSPLNDKDLGEFEHWLRADYMDFVKQQTENLSPADRNEQLRQAFQYTRQLNMASPEAAAAQQSISGIKLLLLLSLRHQQPQVTMVDVAELLSSPEVARMVKERMAEVSQGSDPKNPTKLTPINLSPSETASL